MYKKNLTVFVVGLLFAIGAIIFLYSGNKSVSIDFKYEDDRREH